LRKYENKDNNVDKAKPA